VGVLVLLVVEVSGHRSLPVETVQLVLIGGIVVSSVLDLADFRRQRRDGSDHQR